MRYRAMLVAAVMGAVLALGGPPSAQWGAAAIRKPPSQPASRPVLTEKELAEIKVQLLSDNPGTRAAALNRLWGQKLADSFIEPVGKLADDPDPKVRRNVAIILSTSWIELQRPNNPAAIAILVRMAGDADADVRYAAVYYGLSRVEKKSDEVIAALISVAMKEPMRDDLRGPGGVGAGGDGWQAAAACAVAPHG